MFIITNDKAYIHQTATGIATSNDIENATQFEDKDKAVNFYKNMPKTFRNIGFVVKEIQKNEALKMQWNFDDYFNPDCMDGIHEEIQNMQTLFRQIYKQKEYAEEQLDICEKEITDICHAAEFYNLNAAQGFKLYKMLQDARVNRRKFKDQLLIISFIMDGKMEDIVNGTVLRRIDGMENRQYRPRILDELFEAERNVQ